MKRLVLLAVTAFTAIVTGASAHAQSVTSLLDEAANTASAVASSGLGAIANQVGSGGNTIQSVHIDAEATTGSVTSVASIVNVASGTMKDSTVGNLETTQRVNVGNITAIGSGVDLASWSIVNSSMGNVTLDLNAQINGDVTAIASYVGVADVSITDTTVGGDVWIRAHANTGPITAIASIVRIASFHF